LRALLDHSVPRGLRTVLAGVEVKHAFEMGWHELRNGELLRAAERDGFDVLITSDKNIRDQNRLGGMRIAVLELGTNHWLTLQRHAETISVALADLGHGVHRRVAVPRPPLVRRPPPEHRESD
jgi:predicted nuclease of predicted toxin-antitoxin system